LISRDRLSHRLAHRRDVDHESNDEQLKRHRTLLVAHIHRRPLRRIAERRETLVGDDAHDLPAHLRAELSSRPGHNLPHRQALAQRIFVRKILAHHRFVDHGGERGALPIQRTQQPASTQLETYGGEIRCAHGLEVADGTMGAVDAGVSADLEEGPIGGQCIGSASVNATSIDRLSLCTPT
jgi:hypothetical protein